MSYQHFRNYNISNVYNSRYAKELRQPDTPTVTEEEDTFRVYANIPERNIPQGKMYRIVSKTKPDGDKKDKKPKNTEELSRRKVKMEGFASGFPIDYKLSNIPIHVQKVNLQSYYFPFTGEELDAMMHAPKVIIDRWHEAFATETEVLHKTDFYAVAPNPFMVGLNRQESLYSGNYALLTKTYLPILYRFSVIRNTKKKDHYSISVHGIVGGKEDGWLFLGRLDNGEQDTMHKMMVNPENSAELMARYRSQPVLKYTPKQQELIDHFKRKYEENHSDAYGFVMHQIPFPHIHIADPDYRNDTIPERICPKHIEENIDFSFAENLAFMMHTFHIADRPHFYYENTRLADIVAEERYCVHNARNPNPHYLIDEITRLEQFNSARDFELLEPKVKKEASVAEVKVTENTVKTPTPNPTPTSTDTSTL